MPRNRIDLVFEKSTKTTKYLSKQLQGDWAVRVPLKYFILARLLPDIQEAKCSEFKVQIPPPP